MAYARHAQSTKASFLRRLMRKVGKALAKRFPYNPVRIRGLRLCGFTVGSNVYIGEDLIVASPISENSCDLRIEDRVAIGPRVTIVLSSDANWSVLMEKLPYIRGTVVLKNDCWIGAGAIILPGVIIGERAIVGAGAVVTRSVPDEAVVVGVPAEPLK